MTQDGDRGEPKQNGFERSSRGRGSGRYGRGGSSANRSGAPPSRFNKQRPGQHSDEFAPIPEPMDNLWPQEEKWDVNSDGDWRGR